MRPARVVEHPVHDLIHRRWSPRAFSDRTVEPEKLQRIFEAARWSPSSSNGQPWSYLVATKDDPADYDRMLGCLVDANQIWAKTAPVLAVVTGAIAFERNGKPNRHAYYDAGAATAYLTVEALSLGLFVHQMGGFSPDKVREAYGVPASSEPIAAMAIGYIGDPDTLPDDLRKRELEPSSRKPKSDFVFTGTWGKRPGWI